MSNDTPCSTRHVGYDPGNFWDPQKERYICAGGDCLKCIQDTIIAYGSERRAYELAPENVHKFRGLSNE